MTAFSLDNTGEFMNRKFVTVKTIVRDIGWEDTTTRISRSIVGFFTNFDTYHQRMFTHFAHVLMDDMGWHWLVKKN